MPKHAFVAMLLLVCSLAADAAPPPAAAVERLAGEASAVEAGASRTLKTGDSLFAASLVRTGARSQLQLKFADGAVLAVGPNAELAIGAFSYPEQARLQLNLGKGAFRFLSGLIGKLRHEDVQIDTPVATIGIRGTHFGAEVAASSAVVLLLDQPAGGPNGVVVSNQYGSVTIDQPGFGTRIPDAHSAPSPVRRLRLDAVEQMTRSAFENPGLH